MTEDIFDATKSRENVNVPKALTPQEGPDSYTYSFKPILTDEIFQSMGNPHILDPIVSRGGGLQRMQEMTINKAGQHISQKSREINLGISKKTPRPIVQKVFDALNATGKIKINLSTEKYG